MKKSLSAMIIYTLTFLLLLISFFPLVAGDGMPAIRYGEGDGAPNEIFNSIFESRQLATVELINNSHERISLFLSVYSLAPGDNLTIMVPLRTLPVNVSGKPMNEKEFREEYKIKKTEHEVIRQNMDNSLNKFKGKIKDNFKFAFGSLIWTLPGEYTRQNIHQIETDSGYDEAKGLGAGGDEFGKPEPIQHYEFDGFSIDVFGVSAGPRLSEYLEEKGLMLPEIGALDKYNSQYVAIIESKTKPPISETKFQALENYTPNSLKLLIEELKNNPTLEEHNIYRLKRDLQDSVYEEYESYIQSKETFNDNHFERKLRDYMEELVDAVFGVANFDGEVLKVVLPLDNGKMFFPLGTSAGWSNNVGDIDILFKVPKNKALTLPHSKDAFFDNHHWYLIQMKNSNPDYDLESSLKSSDSDRKVQMERAGFIYDNSETLAIFVIFIILIIYWFGLALILRWIKKTKYSVFKNHILWLLLGLSLIISIPGALLLLLFIKPIPPKELIQEPLPATLLLLYPCSIVLFLIGVVL